MRLLFFVLLISAASAAEIPSSYRSEAAIKYHSPFLKRQIRAKGLKYGAPIFLRVFKQSSEMELWIENKNKKFELFKTYDICHFSGKLGPKTRVGDYQAPEGFYFVKPNHLNPWSQYHLSFNIGYPNAYDRFHRRTGSALMVHGDCVSAGCYAMTDPKIEEIYTLAVAAFENGQAYFRVHVFPFRLTDKTLKQYEDHKWVGFWQHLQEGYKFFEERRVPPNIGVKEGKYFIQN